MRQTRKAKQLLFQGGAQDGQLFSSLAAFVVCGLVTGFFAVAVRLPLNLSDAGLRRQGVAVLNLPVLGAPEPDFGGDILRTRVAELTQPEPIKGMSFLPVPRSEPDLKLLEGLEIFDGGLEPPLPRVQLSTPQMPRGEVGLSVGGQGRGRLADGALDISLKADLWRSYVGQTAEFLVQVDGLGNVLTTWLVRSSSEVLGEEVQRWLRRQKFSAGRGTEFLQLNFEVVVP